jgi:phosphoribosylformimino-5-aminoimidazole carboxamide ribotide isomerase
VDVFPAIDIRSGRVVRLAQGEATEETFYHADPVALAEHYVWQGARWIHIVDLDRAFGDGDNSVIIDRLIKRVGSFVQIQLGGGLRTLDKIKEVSDLHVSRFVLGTTAATDEAFVPQVLEAIGNGRVAVGLDARNGLVALRGWRETSTLRVQDVAARVVAQGVRWIIYTDINRDGMMGGVDVKDALTLQLPGVGVIVSGGVAKVEDIAAVRDAGLAGVVVGRALYEGRFTLPEALQCASAA